MEQRSEIIKRFNINRKQSLLLEHEVNGRVISFRIRKPSTCDFEDTIPFIHSPVGQTPIIDESPDLGSSDQRSASASATPIDITGVDQQEAHPSQRQDQDQQARPAFSLNNLRPDETNVRRMQTALTLNKAIVDRSRNAKLVIINLPGAPKESTPEAENNCKFFKFPRGLEHSAPNLKANQLINWHILSP